MAEGSSTSMDGHPCQLNRRFNPRDLTEHIIPCGLSLGREVSPVNLNNMAKRSSTPENQGGKNSERENIFGIEVFNNFMNQCVSEEKGMTVEESLKGDGPFIDDPSDCTLSDHEFQNLFNNEDKSTKTFLAISDGNDNILCQEAVNLGQEVSQKSFSDVYRISAVLKLAKSVCIIAVEKDFVGTGFVLCDNLILTNAHLFRGCVVEDRKHLQEGINVFVLFNYDCPEPYTDYRRFSVKKTFIDFSDGELDYAVLQLNPEGHKVNCTKTVKLPAGLLKKFGPVPQNGEACIIGHPKGGLKKSDPIYIIEKENREQAVYNNLQQYKKSPFLLSLIFQEIINQGIENILIDGNKADKVVTYNTFMLHGSSGSPVFDADCRVFGLHTGGYVYGYPNYSESVIEFAQPLLTIFESLVTKIKESGDKELLKRVEEEAKGNWHLEKFFQSVELNESSRDEEAKRNPNPEEEIKVEPEDSDEPMDID